MYSNRERERERERHRARERERARDREREREMAIHWSGYNTKCLIAGLKEMVRREHQNQKIDEIYIQKYTRGFSFFILVQRGFSKEAN